MKIYPAFSTLKDNNNVLGQTLKLLADKFSKDAKVKLTLFQKIGQKTIRRLGYETMLDERKIVVRMYKLAKRAFAKFRVKRLWGARGSKEDTKKGKKGKRKEEFMRKRDNNQSIGQKQ